MFDSRLRLIAVSLTFLAASLPAVAVSQQVSVDATNGFGGSGFSENVGVDFGFSHVTPRSVMFFRNRGGAIPPTFGGTNVKQPAAAFGARGRRGNWNWGLGISASQGSDRFVGSTTSQLTLPNGGFGYINNTLNRPFVTGIVPFVGQQTFWPLHSAAVRNQFAAAAERYKQERAANDLAEAKELERLEANSKPTSRPVPHLAPPLIMHGDPSDPSQ